MNDDISLKERIISNYRYKRNNYESITNFNNLKLENNIKYETILKNIIKGYNEPKNNQYNINNENLVQSQLIKKNNNYKRPSFNIIINKKDNNNDNLNENYNNSRLYTVNYDKLWEKAKIVKVEPVEEANKFDEINNLKNPKKINNMITLNSGNLAISSNKMINIYNIQNICNNNKLEEQLLIKIELKDNKPITYMHQLPDDTLLFGTFSRIYRIKLYENEKKYDVLEFIKVKPSELVRKIISLGDYFILILSEYKRECQLRLGIKSNCNNYNFSEEDEEVSNNNIINNDGNNNNMINNENNNNNKNDLNNNELKIKHINLDNKNDSD